MQELFVNAYWDAFRQHYNNQLGDQSVINAHLGAVQQVFNVIWNPPDIQEWHYNCKQCFNQALAGGLNAGWNAYQQFFNQNYLTPLPLFKQRLSQYVQGRQYVREPAFWQNVYWPLFTQIYNNNINRPLYDIHVEAHRALGIVLSPQEAEILRRIAEITESSRSTDLYKEKFKRLYQMAQPEFDREYQSYLSHVSPPRNPLIPVPTAPPDVAIGPVHTRSGSGGLVNFLSRASIDEYIRIGYAVTENQTDKQGNPCAHIWHDGQGPGKTPIYVYENEMYTEGSKNPDGTLTPESEARAVATAKSVIAATEKYISDNPLMSDAEKAQFRTMWAEGDPALVAVLKRVYEAEPGFTFTNTKPAISNPSNLPPPTVAIGGMGMSR